MLRNLYQIQEFKSRIQKLQFEPPWVKSSYKKNNDQELFWDLLFKLVDDEYAGDADDHENDQLNLICMMRMF